MGRANAPDATYIFEDAGGNHVYEEQIEEQQNDIRAQPREKRINLTNQLLTRQYNGIDEGILNPLSEFLNHEEKKETAILVYSRRLKEAQKENNPWEEWKNVVENASTAFEILEHLYGKGSKREFLRKNSNPYKALQNRLEGKHIRDIDPDLIKQYRKLNPYQEDSLENRVNNGTYLKGFKEACLQPIKSRFFKNKYEELKEKGHNMDNYIMLPTELGETATQLTNRWKNIKYAELLEKMWEDHEVKSKGVTNTKPSEHRSHGDNTNFEGDKIWEEYLDIPKQELQEGEQKKFGFAKKNK